MDSETNNTPTPGNSMPTMDMGSMSSPPNKSVGPLIGVIVIIAVIVLGGLYFWGQRLDEQKQDETMLQNDEAAAQLETQSSSDEIADIEADLEASEFDDLDAELNELEADINASAQ